VRIVKIGSLVWFNYMNQIQIQTWLNQLEEKYDSLKSQIKLNQTFLSFDMLNQIKLSFDIE